MALKFKASVECTRCGVIGEMFPRTIYRDGQVFFHLDTSWKSISKPDASYESLPDEILCEDCVNSNKKEEIQSKISELTKELNRLQNKGKI